MERAVSHPAQGCLTAVFTHGKIAARCPGIPRAGRVCAVRSNCIVAAWGEAIELSDGLTYCQGPVSESDGGQDALVFVREVRRADN